MRRILALLPCLLLLVVAAPALSRPWSPPPPYRLPNLSGTWFNSGDENQPCYIRMRPDGSALFTNENGSTAPGEVRVGRVIIPDWSAGEDVPVSYTHLTLPTILRV